MEKVCGRRGLGTLCGQRLEKPSVRRGLEKVFGQRRGAKQLAEIKGVWDVLELSELKVERLGSSKETSVEEL